MPPASTVEQIQALERLIALINPSAVNAKVQISALQSLLSEANPGAHSPYQLMQLFSQATRPVSSFYVDWKDTDTLTSCINNMAKSRQIEINWAVDDKLNHNYPDLPDVHVLLEHASDQFLAHQLRLWGWDTSGEDYGGWLAPIALDAEIQSIAQQLGIDFYIACTGNLPEQLAQTEKPGNLSESDYSNLSLIQRTFTNFKHQFSDKNVREQIKSSWQLLKFLLLMLLLVPLIFLFKGMLKCVNLIQEKLNKSD